MKRLSILVAASLLAISACSQPYGPGTRWGDGPESGRYGYGMGPGMMGGYGYGMGPGMMGGYGYGMGPGMMGGYDYGMGPGMMGGYGYGMGPGMMGGYGYGMGPGMMGGYGYGMGPGMMGGYGYGMGPGMMGGYGPGAYGPGFTDEQRTKLAEIQNELGRKQWALMEKMRALAGASADGRYDEQAERKAYEATADLRKQMFENSLEAHKRMDSLLTPQQREQLNRGWRGR